MFDSATTLKAAINYNKILPDFTWIQELSDHAIIIIAVQDARNTSIEFSMLLLTPTNSTGRSCHVSMHLIG